MEEKAHSIARILERYAESDRIARISGTLEAAPSPKIHLCNITGSGLAFVASAIMRSSPRVHVFLLGDTEEAAYFLNDLETIVPQTRPLFFPASCREHYTGSKVRSQVRARAEVLERIAAGSSSAIAVTTFPEAIAEKVVTRAHLAERSFVLEVGAGADIESLRTRLIGYDFEPADFVYEPGRFAIRGGIVDIFSYAGENPCRVEFEGNRIASIRTFDPASQLSLSHYSRFTVIPDVQDKMLQESRTTFPEYLPDGSVLWVRDADLVAGALQKTIGRAEKNFAALPDPAGHLAPAELLMTPAGFLEQLARRPVVEWSARAGFTPDAEVAFDFVPQPSFNKNFRLLADDLHRNHAAGFWNIIATDSPKQAERLYAIMEDSAVSDGRDTGAAFACVTGSLHEGFIDRDLKLACYTDHQVFNRYHKFRLHTGYTGSMAITLKELYGLHPGDFVTHIDHGVGRFDGLETIDVNGKKQEAVRIRYKDGDILYVSIHSLHRITRFSGKEGHEPKVNKLGTKAWQNLKQRTKSRVKDIARELIALYARRKAQEGFRFSPDTYLQHELEASFLFEDTPDQVKTTAEVKKDMESPAPMDRLVCGDVGFGKTEIAIRAAFKAVADSKQVAVLAPTTILTMQHHRTFSERLSDFPCRVDYINRFRTAGEVRATLKDLAGGKIDIIIGTHRLLSKDVVFKDLGLLIVDEEQKFGVAAKEKLKALRVTVDILTLTATPIPRTLHFSLMGARDLSVISTPPPNRYPIQTELHPFGEAVIREAISYELARGGQVFFVHNRVQNIGEVSAMVSRLVPEARVAVAHGQMDGPRLEGVMAGFIEGRYDVLVSTTIIESGLDIPNANTIVINQAHMYGLSDLHQMRGRVGRSNRKAFCYLLSPPLTALTPDARRRLRTLEEFSDLSAGFNIAMRDLDIRGAGNLLGAEQSGFIAEMGFEAYHRILDEAVAELKDEAADTTSPAPDRAGKGHDCQVETDLEILLPDNYVNTMSERLSLYRELNGVKEEDGLAVFERNLADRFGPVPEPARALSDVMRLKWQGEALGLSRMVLKEGRFIAYFPPDGDKAYYNSNTFSAILSFVQRHGSRTSLGESAGRLRMTVRNVPSVKEALNMLQSVTASPKVEAG